MNIYKYDIVFQEVPHHISLAFYVCGCPLKCKGCHSPELWTENTGFPLTMKLYVELLQRYQEKADCILFLGGEWCLEELKNYLQLAQAKGFKTALYTGLEVVSPTLLKLLDFVKVGPWREELGGLESPATNQVFYDLSNNLKLNHLFQNEFSKELL